MFVVASLTATVPCPADLDRMEGVRERLQDQMDSVAAFRLQLALTVDLRLVHQAKPVVFYGCEPTLYAGRTDKMLVFGIKICDDEPVWLTEILDLPDDGLPREGEVVYVIVPNAPSKIVKANIALYTEWGKGDGWDLEADLPLTDAQLAKLLELTAT